MHFEFDAKIEKAIEKSIRSATRLFREQIEQAQPSGTKLPPPSYDQFLRVVEEFMETLRRKDLGKLRTPSLRELFERAWAQELRNYATQELLHDSYRKLVRRF